MDFIVSGMTDIGLVKTTNQDSYNLRVYSTSMGKIVFAILCDGMGGLDKGEIASKTVVNAFCKWSDNNIKTVCSEGIDENKLTNEWINIVKTYNEKIKAYANSLQTNMGTTVTVMMIIQNKYYILNVGDTRAYEINEHVQVLTKDHTVVTKEIELGNITEEQANKDYRRSILLQCVGASDDIKPDVFIGNVKLNSVYMLCSDGFRHEITNKEIHEYLNPNVILNEKDMNNNIKKLIDMNKQRQEKDNISVLAIRTF